MVSIRYQKQETEEANRKERLVAARRAAAALSIQQARSYQTQKKQQGESVRADLEVQWANSIAEKQRTLEQLLRAGQTKEAEGMQDAVAVIADKRARVCEEAAAWQAEHQLEDARHRLAVAVVRTSGSQQSRHVDEFVQRRGAIMTAERQRAAQMTAASLPTRAATLDSAIAQLQGTRQSHCDGVVCFPLDGERVAASDYWEEACPHRAAESVQRRTQERKTAAAVAIEACVDNAAKTALEDQVHKQIESTSKRMEKERQKEHKLRVAEAYRAPPDAEDDDDDMEPAAAFTRHPEPAPRNSSAQLQQHTARQRAVKASKEAEADFVNTFVKGPPVMVRATVRPAAVRTMEELLRAGAVQDLLAAPATTVGPLPDEGAAAPPVPFTTRSLFRSPASVTSQPQQPITHVPADPSPSSTPLVPNVAGAPLPVCVETAVQTEVVIDLGEDDDHVPPTCAAVNASQVTDVTNISVSTPSDEDGGDEDDSQASRSSTSSASPPQSSRTTEVLSENSTLSLNASSMSSYSRPSMTAEQLKISLIRLRNRMRNAQI